METLHTPRLILRPWRQEDAEELLGMACEPVIGEMAGWESNDEDAVERILSKPGVYVIVSRLSGRPVGCIELKYGSNVLRSSPNDAEVSYWIGTRYWDKGYATEALKEVLDYAFESGVPKVWAQSLGENGASVRVLEKCGFKLDHRGVFENGKGSEVVANVYLIGKRGWERWKAKARSVRRSRKPSPPPYYNSPARTLFIISGTTHAR